MKYTTDITANSKRDYNQKIDYEEFKLSNGLHCILHKDTRNPIICLNIAYKVGSKNEPEGKKGVAHLFEHLMFEGSLNLKKNGHFSTVLRAGGKCNAFTSHDFTNYYDILPSNHLETALWLESDRMMGLDLTEENLANQKSVVLEEKMQRYDNAPYGTLSHNMFSIMFKDSVYEAPIIGYDDDIKSFSVEDAQAFHKKYYSPQNAVLVLTGDFDTENAKVLIEKYFGNIENGDDIENASKEIPLLDKEVKFEYKDKVKLPLLAISFPVEGLKSDDRYAMDFIWGLLSSGRSSALYKEIVYKKKLAQSAKAYPYLLEDGGMFVFNAMINADADIDEVEKAIMDVIKNYEPDEDSLFKVKNKLIFGNISSLEQIQNKALELARSHIFYNDAGEFNEYPDKMQDITIEDIKSFMDKHLKKDEKLVMKYIPLNEN